MRWPSNVQNRRLYNYLSRNADYDRFVVERDATFVFDKNELAKAVRVEK